MRFFSLISRTYRVIESRASEHSEPDLFLPKASLHTTEDQRHTVFSTKLDIRLAWHHLEQKMSSCSNKKKREKRNNQFTFFTLQKLLYTCVALFKLWNQLKRELSLSLHISNKNIDITFTRPMWAALFPRYKHLTV